MSKGSGKVERRIAELFAAAGPDGLERTYTVAELAAAVFETNAPTRPQRLSVKRAVRSAYRRVRKVWRAAHELFDQAYHETLARFGGREPRLGGDRWYEFRRALESHPKAVESQRLHAKTKAVDHMGHWHETVRADGVVVFHYFTRPVRIWAVTIARHGVEWFEAEIEEVTRDRVSVRYQGVRCPLNRSGLSWNGVWWRGVCFVSRQDGHAAAMFWQQWQESFGHLEPLRMPLDQARQLLGVSENYDRDEVIKAFRKLALKHHPDHGGDAEMFRKLVEARDLLLSLIGTKAEPVKVKEPTFYPSGTKIAYRVWRPTNTPRIRNGGARLLA